jgi:DNA-binding SARP family transcriptional activator
VAVRFRVLGSVEAEIDGNPVDLGHARQRLVLAALLVDANRPVPGDRLADRVWAECPPRDARGVLYSYLSRLRRALAADGVTIARQPAGYMLSCDPSTVDLHLFTELTSHARRAGDGAAALVALDAALGLWRGDAFGTLDTPWVNRTREALERRRLAAELDRNDHALDSGRHADLLPELLACADRYPLDERLAGQLMLALCRSGRQADALDRYQRIRERLADELGTDPGTPLRALYQRILRADPALLGPPPPAPAPARPTGRPVPRQLPAPPALFTGRTRELAELDAVMAAVSPVVISAVAGTGGIGKTWLAVQWAHRNAGRYPDGQLYADLRGFDPAGEPVQPEAVLRGFLDALGIPPAAVPAGRDAMAARYRSLVADRRMLILLDNARDAAVVLPLLPAAPGCGVLVTSRRQLAGLVVAHGARPLHLDLLSDADGRELLAARLGAARVAAEPEAVGALLRYCAGLPLALGIVAARAVLNPQVPLAALAAELCEATGRLDGLDAGELACSLRAVLSWSLPALSPQAVRAFRLLGLVPGPDLALPAVASLLATTPQRARRLIRELAEAHLVDEPVPGRYRMHDLVRLYAAERAAAEEPAAVHRAALGRLFDHYIHTADAADRAFAPYRHRLIPTATAPAVTVVAVDGEHDAFAWFTVEHAVLLSTIRYALASGAGTAAWQLAWAVTTFLFRQGHWDDCIAVQHLALEAVGPCGDMAVRAWFHRGLARICSRLDRRDEARRYAETALDLFTRLGDAPGQARTHQDLAQLATDRHDYPQAMRHAQAAVTLLRSEADTAVLAAALNALGWITALAGAPKRALPYCEQAQALLAGRGDRHQEAAVWDSLGYIHHRLGHHTHAVACYDEAVSRFRANGHRYLEACVLDKLGDVWADADDRQAAHAAWHRALGILDELDRPEAAAVRAKLGY